MPVLARFYGIVIRMLSSRTFGTHFHAFYGDSELVIGLNPLRVIQGEAPSWVREWALDWVRHYQSELLLARTLEHAPKQSIHADGQGGERVAGDESTPYEGGGAHVLGQTRCARLCLAR
jgi:hypothetical protein